MSRLIALVFIWLGAVQHVLAGPLPDPLDMNATTGSYTIQRLLTDVTRVGESRLVAVGEYGAIVYSDDAGENWRAAKVPVQVTLTAVHFFDALQGWAVGHDAVILHSNDAGRTWNKQLDGRETGKKLLANAQAHLQALEEEQNALAESELNELSEEALAARDMAEIALDEAQREIDLGPNRPFLDVWFADANNGIAVGAFNYYFTTSDGGKNWNDASLQLPNPDMLHLYSISPTVENGLIIVGEFGLVLRSLNAGKSWEAISLGYEGSLFSVAGEGAEVWVAGLRGNIFHSADNGSTWQHLERQGDASLLGIEVQGPRKARFVGLGGVAIDVDLSGDDAQFHSSHPAAQALAASTESVFVGQAGIARVNVDGTQLPIQFVIEDQ